MNEIIMEQMNDGSYIFVENKYETMKQQEE